MGTGFQYAMNFTEYFMFIGNKVEHTVTDDNVGNIGYNGDIFNIALSELYVVEAKLICIGSCLCYHGFSEINTDDPSLFTRDLAGNEGVITGAASEVNDEISFFYPGEFGG